MQSGREDETDAERLHALASRLAADHLLRRDLRLLACVPAPSAGMDLVALDARADATVFVRLVAARAPGSGPLLPSKGAQAGDEARRWLSGAAVPVTAHVRFDTIRVIVDERDAMVRLDHLEGVLRRRAVRGPAAGMPATGRTSGAGTRRRS